MEKKKDNKQIIIIVLGVIIYFICSMLQSKLARPTNVGGGAPTAGNNPMAGVISQVQVVVTVVLVLFAKKNGYITAVVLNGINALFTLIVQMILNHSTKAMPGFLVTLISIGIASVIYFYTSKTEKMNEELQVSYQEAIEKNRIIEEQTESMRFLAYYDRLTSMTNRANFMDKLEKQIKESGDCVMIYVDMDDFRRINDNYGHEAGDKVLAEFASLLKELFGETSIISRYGGDEFLVFISEAYKPKIEFLMSELRRRVHEIKPITQKENDTFVVSCSCGGALCPDDAKDFEMLKKCADAALYEVKEMGRDGYRWYGGRDTDDGPIQ